MAAAFTKRYEGGSTVIYKFLLWHLYLIWMAWVLSYPGGKIDQTWTEIGNIIYFALAVALLGRFIVTEKKIWAACSSQNLGEIFNELIFPTLAAIIGILAGTGLVSNMATNTAEAFWYNMGRIWVLLFAVYVAHEALSLRYLHIHVACRNKSIQGLLTLLTVNIFCGALTLVSIYATKDCADCTYWLDFNNVLSLATMATFTFAVTMMLFGSTKAMVTLRRRKMAEVAEDEE